MSIIQQLLENREEFILKVLDLIEGKEAKTRLNLNGVKLKFGKADVKLEGNIEISVMPVTKKKKK